MPESEAYQQVGRAVIAAQALEVLFALCVQLVFQQSDAQTKADIKQLPRNFSKRPTVALLKELRNTIDITPAFEQALLSFVERRHVLIHRWGIEHGLPQDEEGYKKIASFAQQLSRDALDLSAFLTNYLVTWLRRYPEIAEASETQEALRALPIPEHMRKLTIEKS